MSGSPDERSAPDAGFEQEVRDSIAQAAMALGETLTHTLSVMEDLLRRPLTPENRRIVGQIIDKAQSVVESKILPPGAAAEAERRIRSLREKLEQMDRPPEP